MPRYENGDIRADIIMDPISINSRMNNGRLFEQYFNGASRKAKSIIMSMTIDIGKMPDTLNNEELDNVWRHVVEFTSYVNPKQSNAYAQATYEEKIEILNEIINEEFYIYYTVSDEPAYIIVDRLEKTIYKPEKDYVIFRSTGTQEVFRTNEPMYINPEYIIVLSKTAESYLSTASSKVNHHGLPISDSSKNKVRIPWRNTPVKTLSETDSRVYGSYVGRLGLIELKDRANSLDTHKAIYKNILEADKPTQMKQSIDRAKHPYGGDAALKIIDNVLSVGGAELVFTPDKHKIHPVLKGQ